MGRPRKVIDLKTLDELAHIHCTYEEIAAVLDVSTDTLKRRFADRIEKAREGGKMSLRRAQFAKAIDEGHPTMLIWLGKQHLGQSDKTEQNITGALDTAHAIKDALTTIERDVADEA